MSSSFISNIFQYLSPIKQLYSQVSTQQNSTSQWNCQYFKFSVISPEYDYDLIELILNKFNDHREAIKGHENYKFISFVSKELEYGPFFHECCMIVAMNSDYYFNDSDHFNFTSFNHYIRVKVENLRSLNNCINEARKLRYIWSDNYKFMRYVEDTRNSEQYDDIIDQKYNYFEVSKTERVWKVIKLDPNISPQDSTIKFR